MAVTITTQMCDVAKVAFLRGEHLAADTYKMALIDVTGTGTYGLLTTAYGTSAGAPTVSISVRMKSPLRGSYADGGFTMTGYATGSTGSTSWIDWTTDPSFTTATISAVGAMLYNDTDAGKPAIATFSFGGTITSTAGTFTITLPAAAAATALIRIA